MAVHEKAPAAIWLRGLFYIYKHEALSTGLTLCRCSVHPRLKLNIYPRYVIFNSDEVGVRCCQQAALLRLS